MSEMSDYTPDFLTNTLDADEMQRFIEIASEIEKLPTSSTMKRVRETKSDGFLDAMGNLLFDNPAAIPEMFVESLSSFLPAAIKSMIVTVPTGAAIGTVITPRRRNSYRSRSRCQSILGCCIFRTRSIGHGSGRDAGIRR